MKIFSEIAIIIVCVFILPLASCESPDLSEGRNDQVNGLLNVTIRIPGNAIEYNAEKKGPYNEGEEIVVKVPTSDEAPLDLTRLICTVSVEHNCYVDPPLGGELDFTEPRKITVIDVNGTLHHNTIRVEPVYPKTRFINLWKKSCLDLGLATRNNTGVAMNEKYLAVQEYDGPIYLFDKDSGEFIKKIDAARTFMMKIDVDAAGHFVTARENIYGAGFMVYYYSETENEHKLLLDYTDADGCPADMGYEMSVIGDVTKGRAFIYGMAPDDMYIYYWELQDGTLLTPANQPNKLRYGAAKGNWSRAQIQRATLDDSSEHYISYYRPSADDAENENSSVKQGSRFNIFSTAMEVVELEPSNHAYKILDFKVFNVEQDQFLVLNEQNYSAWGNSKVQVFEITDRSMMKLKPGENGYDKFNLFSGEEIAPTNYNVWGDVAVYSKSTSSGYDVYIAAATVGFDTNESVIRMYKMSYNPQ